MSNFVFPKRDEKVPFIPFFSLISKLRGMPEENIPEVKQAISECNIPECNIPECNIPECNIPECNIPEVKQAIPECNIPEVKQAIPAFFSFMTRLRGIPDIKANIKEAIPETKPEAIPETKPEAIPETKLEAIPETKLEVIPEMKLEVIPETKEAEAIPVMKLEAIPEMKPAEAVTETKEPEAIPEMKPAEAVTETKEPEALPETKEAEAVPASSDWTINVSGNLNGFLGRTTRSGINVTNGINGTNRDTNSFTSGLLPSSVGFTGKTRQNDFDIDFTLSIEPKPNEVAGLENTGLNNNLHYKQASLTVTDKSWGSFKLGKDLGVYGRDDILIDMTLLGVGSQGITGGSRGGAVNDTLGRIGAGYLYPDYITQLNYTTPNINGLDLTVGIANPPMSAGAFANSNKLAYQGKISYDFTDNIKNINGKCWSGFTLQNLQHTATGVSYNANAVDLGANLNFGKFGITASSYKAHGMGTPLNNALYNDNSFNIANTQRRSSQGGYLQATYVLPTQTKIGVKWGEDKIDLSTGETVNANVKSNEMWTYGAYHPLTQNLNLVAEYNDVESKAHNGLTSEAKTVSLGGILYF